jgi:hypothetical protein
MGVIRRRVVAGLSARVGTARERASESGRGHKWARGGGRAVHEAQKGRGGSNVAEERAVVGASMVGDRGREVRDKLTGGDGGAERGRAGAHERTSADRSGPRDRERSREAHSGWHRQAGPACQAERARGRERARGGWAKWAALGRIIFSFFLEFLIAFIFIFSRVFNSSFKFKPNQICATIQRIFRLNMMQHSMTHMFWEK